MKYLEAARALKSARNETFAELLVTKKCQWLDILNVKSQRALVQSCLLDANQLDAPAKYFFRQEKKNGQNRFILMLRGWSLTKQMSGKGQQSFAKVSTGVRCQVSAALRVASTKVFHS